MENEKLVRDSPYLPVIKDIGNIAKQLACEHYYQIINA